MTITERTSNGWVRGGRVELAGLLRVTLAAGLAANLKASRCRCSRRWRERCRKHGMMVSH